MRVMHVFGCATGCGLDGGVQFIDLCWMGGGLVVGYDLECCSWYAIRYLDMLDLVGGGWYAE